ncbi:MAG: hypothetical protein AB4063_13440 [Crocosphaera sp.]
MKFSDHRFIEHDQSNALDFGDQTVIQRHRGQQWKYQYPRHIKPHFSRLSKPEGRINKLLESQVIISQGLEDHVCSISTQPTQTFTVNEVNKIYLQNVCRNLERRLKKAQIQGDQWLIRLLEKEVEEMGEFCVI